MKKVNKFHRKVKKGLEKREEKEYNIRLDTIE